MLLAVVAAYYPFELVLVLGDSQQVLHWNDGLALRSQGGRGSDRPYVMLVLLHPVCGERPVDVPSDVVTKVREAANERLDAATFPRCTNLQTLRVHPVLAQQSFRPVVLFRGVHPDSLREEAGERLAGLASQLPKCCREKRPENVLGVERNGCLALLEGLARVAR